MILAYPSAYLLSKKETNSSNVFARGKHASVEARLAWFFTIARLRISISNLAK